MLKTLTINLAILLCAVCFSFSIKAQTNQPGDIDLSFNPTDVGFGQGDGTNGRQPNLLSNSRTARC